MTRTLCREFQNWLERLPRSELSPEFQQHIETCDSCRQLYTNLNEVAEKLASVVSPKKLEKSKLTEISNHALSATDQYDDRRLAVKLGIVSILSFPCVIAINWLWGTLGFNIISTYISPVAADIYIVLFVFTATGIAGLSYGAIPLLAGWLSNSSSGEKKI